MKNILIPTDFSINAQKAIDYAILLFKKEECTFHILHAYQMAPSAPGVKLDSENQLNQIVKKLKAEKENPLHNFKNIMIADTPLSAIDVSIKNNDVDYVFMGTKGAKGLQGIFMGSTTVNVIKNIGPCPIVAVPEKSKYGVPDEIIFTNNFRNPFKKVEIIPLITLVELCKSTLTVVYIKTGKELSNEQKSNKKLLANNLKKVKHQFLEVVMDYSLSSTIHRLEKENKKIGMVAMLKNKHGFFEKLLREPVVRNVTFTTEVPFLVLPTFE